MFRIRKLFEKLRRYMAIDKIFFRTTEEGKELFYPWGCPGEALLLNGVEKNRVFNGINYYFIFTIGYGLILIFLSFLFEINVIIISRNFFDYLHLCWLGLAFPIYICLLRFLINKNNLYFIINKKVKNYKFLWLYLVNICQFNAFYCTYSVLSPYFLVIFILASFYSFYIFTKIFVSNGNYLFHLLAQSNGK